MLLPAPADSAEGELLLDRFTDSGTGQITPSIQVSLAKRIIMPGSNRVTCLAAHTSVPLNDNELASVSNLALRLADGTRVALSLKVLNDGGYGDIVCGEYVPFQRYTYDPERFTNRNNSHLGLVLVATVTLAAAGLYFALSNGPLYGVIHPATPFSKKAHTSPKGAATRSASVATSSTTQFTVSKGGSKISAPNRAAIGNSMSNSKTSKLKAAGSLATQFSKPNSEAVPKTEHSSRTTTSGSKARAASTEQQLSTAEMKSPKRGYFVPPPPPIMYNWPAGGYSVGSYGQPGLDSGQLPRPNLDLKVKAKAAGSIPQVRTKPSIPVINQFPDSAGSLNSSWEDASVDTNSAPVPGSAYPKLERIVPPAHD